MEQRAFAEEILQEAKALDVQAEVFFCNINIFINISSIFSRKSQLLFQGVF